MAPIGKSIENFKLLQMQKENYENHPKFCKQKFVPMHGFNCIMKNKINHFIPCVHCLFVLRKFALL
jgi:hypothetical protein